VLTATSAAFAWGRGQRRAPSTWSRPRQARWPGSPRCRSCTRCGRGSRPSPIPATRWRWSGSWPHLFDEAIACTQRSGDLLTNATLHNHAGVRALRTGDIPAARAHLEAAGRAGRQIGHESTVWAVNLGLVLRQEGDADGARSTFEAALRMSRRNGERSASAYASLGLACLAGDLGDWDRAAVVHGAAQAVLDRMGEPWQEPEARYRRESLDQARTHLGDEQLKRAYAQGMALSFDQAVNLVLRKADSA
jgi:tetratricopeptide (TPR) repeat protein